MTFARITGTGSYLPEKVVTNFDLEKIVETSDEWITTRSGIKERHIAADDQATSDLSLIAAQRALNKVAPPKIAPMRIGGFAPSELPAG